MPLKVGLGLFTGQVPPGSGRTFAQEYADILALSHDADEAGFDSVWVSEHHGAADGYLPSLTVMLGALAAVTSRVELGMGVVLGPFQHPLRFAEDCAVVDNLAGGRLIVGLAPGWREEEFRAFGIPIKERVGRNAELVKICRLAWTGERFSFQGKYFQYQDVAVTPTPARPPTILQGGGRGEGLRPARPSGDVPPILMGGFVEKAAERAGRLGDGFLASRNDLHWFQRLFAAFERGAREAGKDPARMPIGLLQNSWVSRDGGVPDHVVEGAWHQLGTYAAWRVPNDTPETPYQLPPVDRGAVLERMAAGTPDQVVEAMRPWLAAYGSRDLHIVFRLHYPGMTRAQAQPAVELFASEVIPQLKRLP